MMRERIKSVNPLVWITLIGALFRFAELGSVRLSHDLAWQAWDAARILHGQFPLIGQPSSVFLDNPPLMGYLQAIPLFLWRSPWSIFITITLLNTLAIPFIFAAIDHTLGRRVAIIGTFLFAVNPWIVHFSRMTWTQGLLPLFLAIMAWGWWPIFCSDRTRWHTFQTWELIGLDSSIGMVGDRLRFAAGWLALILMMQTYILAVIMLVPVLILMLLFRKKLPKREVQIGLLIVTLSFAFYAFTVWLNFDQNSTKFQDFFNDVEQGFSSSEETPGLQTLDLLKTIDDDALVHAMRFITGRDYVGQDVNGPETLDPIPVPILSQLARWLLSAAFIVGLIVLLFKRQPMTWILLVWFFVPVVLVMLLPSTVFVHPHYLLFTLPAGGIIAAVGLDWVMGQHKVIYWAALVCLLAISMQFKVSMWQSGRLIARQPKILGLQALPLREAGKIGRQIRAEHDNETRPVPLRVVASANDQVMTAISGVLVDVVEGLDPLEFPDQFVFSQQDQSTIYVTYYKKNDGILVSSLSDFESATGPIENRVEYQTESGLTFLGHSSTLNADGTLQVQSFWRVDVLHDARNNWFVSPFIHLIGTDGQTVANESPFGQWGHRWQVGDVYVSSITLSPTPDAQKVGLGLFDPISGDTFLIQTPDGNIARYETPLE